MGMAGVARLKNYHFDGSLNLIRFNPREARLNQKLEISMFQCLVQSHLVGVESHLA